MAQERDSNEKSPWPTGSRWQTSSNWRTKHLETSKPQEQTETHSRWPAPPTVNRWPQFENSSNSGSNPPTKPRVSSTYPRPVDPDGDKAIALAFTEGRRIYVGNLPYMAKREDVEDLFAEGDGTHPEGHYKIDKIDISIDPFTGRNPSYCFVNMESKEAAEDAITYLNGKDVLGRPVKIKIGVPKAQRPPPFGRRDPTTGDAPEPFVFDRWSRDDAQEHWGKYAPSGRRVIVQGLPKMPNQQTIDYEIRKLFYGFKVEAISKVINPFRLKREEAPREKNHYFLFVDMESPEEANRAILSLDGVGAVWGNRVSVKKYLKNDYKTLERDKWQRWQRGNDGAASPSTAR